jgi:hypothetical protein
MLAHHMIYLRNLVARYLANSEEERRKKEDNATGSAKKSSTLSKKPKGRAIKLSRLNAN